MQNLKKRNIKRRQEIQDMDYFNQEQLINESDLCEGEYSKFLQNYDIIGRIGKGGFSGVYKAYDKKNNCFVAVKRMPQDMSKYELERVNILHELQVVQNLHRGNEDLTNPLFILKCQKYYYRKINDDFEKKSFYELIFIYPLAMRDLFSVIENNREIKYNYPEQKVIPFIQQILKALLSLKNEYGIKHRDLKPQNILLLDEFTYLLADFTTCKIVQEDQEHSVFQLKDSKIERTIGVPHTPDYSPPEVKGYMNNKKSIGKFKISVEKCDVFSLAVTALCLLFHDLRAKNLTDLDDGKKLIDETLDRIKNKDLKELISKMIQWDFEERYTIEQCISFYESKFQLIEQQNEERLFKKVLSSVRELNPTTENQKKNLVESIIKLVGLKEKDQFEINQSDENQMLKQKIVQLENQLQIFSQQSNSQKQIQPQIGLEQSSKKQQQVQEHQIKQNPLNMLKKNINLKKSQKLNVLYQYHTDCINDINFSYCGEYFATCSDDRMINLWETKTQQIVQIIQVHENNVNKIRFTEDNQYLISTGDDYKLCLLFKQDNSLYQKKDEFSDSDILDALYVNKQNPRKILCGGSSKIIFEFEITDQKKLKKIKQIQAPHSLRCGCLQMNKQETLLASGGQDNQIVLWESKTYQKLKILRSFKDEIRDIQFSLDEVSIFACCARSSYKNIQRINFQNEEIIQGFQEHTRSVMQIKLSQNENHLYTVSLDKQLILWTKDEKENNKFKLDQKISFQSEIFSMSLHEESNQMIIGFYDGSLIYMKLRERQQKPEQIK